MAQQWEYAQILRTITLDKPNPDIRFHIAFTDGTEEEIDSEKESVIEALGRLGGDGWELVGLAAASVSNLAFQHLYVLKRPKS